MAGYSNGFDVPHNAVQNLDSNPSVRQPYVRIIEQPAPKALRFRYKCEGRSAGSIPGVNSTSEHKTYPSIQVVGFQGRAVVVVSCVTKDHPYKPHPHNLVGREGCKRGVCTLEIPQDRMMIQFSNLGIQCVKKRDIEAALKVREEIRVDPFRTGFNHKNQPTSIDLNSVRLCFQVFLEGKKKGQFTIPLPPVVSEPIYDKKANGDLVIVELSDCVSYVDGDRKKIILLCEKVAKEDIQVRFYEEKDGVVIWEGFGDFQPSRVHKQVAISFMPPRYHNLEVQEPVKVFVQLKRPSDGATSEPVPFEFLPIAERKRKRPKFDSIMDLNQQLGLGNDPGFLDIKPEPRDIAYRWPQGGIIDVPDMMSTDADQFKIPNIQELPSVSGLGQNSWNIPYMPDIGPDGTLQTVNPDNLDSAGLRSLLDLDSQNTELKHITQVSEELGPFEPGLDVTNLSETLNTNLSLQDIRGDQNMNMTDSLTRLANNTIDNLCQMNSFK